MTKEPQPLAAKYDPQEVEAGRYQFWLNQDDFRPNGNPEVAPYSIILPPPNVTGKLHLGHAWDTTLQDILIRYHRMQGTDTLWVPGMDHAGIATQTKVEAQLRQQGMSRFDLGRQAFVDRVWSWKAKYADTIHQQWAKLGLSLDYAHERFTLDAGASAAVRKVFVTLYRRGLIYRGEYIINWDPQAQTALSDVEVVHHDDPGNLYYLTYPFVDEQETFAGKHYVTVATTRPETLMGDVAIAVNPHDERYRQLVGQQVMVPLANRQIPIIADNYVDPAFGTGMVKITPAHDPNDFAVGNRHHLERINTMNADATLNQRAGKYAGLDRFVAREAMVTDLKRLGRLLKVVPIVHAVGHSERTGVPVEPRLSTQWFVKMQPLAQAAIRLQQTDAAIQFVPQRFEHIYLQWLRNVHDWVISRQLWWGHRIPAWYRKDTGAVYVGEQAPKDPEHWTQDPDVLDTWFSSALWPFVTMGWPDTTQSDYQRYFPTSTLVTGYDIIPFWVSRMVCQSLAFTGKPPFRRVLIHGLMRDAQGVKMSKSLGNGIDPLDVIAKHGADALRWFLATNTADGQDTRFSPQKLDAAWNFINKLWNASRFVIGQLTNPQLAGLPMVTQRDIFDRWLLSRLAETITQVRARLDQFDFGEAGRALINFVRHDFCDWYIELAKPDLQRAGMRGRRKQQMLVFVLDQVLRLLHPLIPFVTEKLWLAMPHQGRSLVTARYPEPHPEWQDGAAEQAMVQIQAVITAVRELRAQVQAPLKTPLDLLLKTDDANLLAVVAQERDRIKTMVNARQLTAGPHVQVPELAITAPLPQGELSVPMAELVDLHQEAQRLEHLRAKLEQADQRSVQKLQNQQFCQQAPAKVIAQERSKHAIAQQKLATINARLQQIRRLP